MNKNRKNHGRVASTPVLNSVGLAVLATLIGGGAQAADSSVRIGAGPATVTTTGYLTVQSVQDEALPVAATASDQDIAITVDGPQAGTTNAVTRNQVGASATANTFGNSIDSSLTGSAGLPTEGAASLGVATNSGVISSSASGNTVALDLNGFSSGGASNTFNTISASTTLNNGTSSIAGTVPNDHASATPGLVNLNYSPDSSSSNALGSSVITSAQQGTGAGSSAVAAGNTVSLELGSNATNAVDSASALDSNTISATLKGNGATSTVDIQAGGAPAFSGSAVVSNQQLNTAVDPVAHTASNVGSTIAATIDSSGAGTANTLQGALSVQGNSITSAATGNESLGAAGVAGNRILLGDDMSFAGSTGLALSNSAYIADSLSANVMADLVISNSQGNVGASLGSATIGATIGAGAQSIDGGSITLSDNSVTSTASGNAASSAIASGQNGASFAGTAAVASQQSNFNSDVSAVTGLSFIGAVTGQEDGTTNASTVAVAGNRSAATAHGNSIGQGLSLEANALPLGGTASLIGGHLPDGITALGAAVVSNQQNSYSGAVSALNAGSIIGLSADSRGIAGDTIHGSTLTVSGNTQEAVSLSNSASNALSLAGTTVGSGAGIVSVQTVDGNSPVWAELADSTASLHAGTHASDSTLSLANNLQRAIGYGNSASNTLNVAANSADVQASGGPASMVDVGARPAVVSAAYGVLNNQSVLGDVSAMASGITAPANALTVLVEGNVNGSSVSNADNAFVAAAYGNDAASAIELALGTGATSAGSSSIANVTNLQAVTGSEITAASGTVVNTLIDGNVSASTVSSSNNPVQALAFGNRSTGNTLAVAGNTIDTASLAPLGGAVVNGSMSTTDAAFSVQNAQTGSGTVTATQWDSLGDTAASVFASTGGSVTGSTVAANGNTSTAAATGNSAANGLSIAANELASSSALQNFQATSASVNALIGQAGVAGSPGIPGGPFNYTVTGTLVFGTYDNVSDTWLVTTGTLNVNATGFSADQIAYLIGDGWTPAGPGIYQKNAAGMTLSPVRYGQLSPASGGATFVGIAAGIPATAGTPNQGGVMVAVGENVTGSLLSVKGNSTSGSVVGNSASNSMAISANEITAGSGQTVASAGVLAAGTGAQADNALSNVQQITGESALRSSVHGTFAIDTAPAVAIAGSTLSVSDNSQHGAAVANTAANSLSVSGTNLSTTSALASQQSSAAAVAAGSNLELYAPGAVSASAVELSRNQNTSLGVINDATNTLTVGTANVSPVGAAVNAQLVAGTAVGDHVLNNSQSATTSVGSTATTRLYNQDQTAAATSGLVDSTMTVTGNGTAAEASANRAVNAVALNGAALHGASAGLANTQTSGAAVTATASTSATFQLEGSAPATSLNSGITIGGNSTTALARGNLASNALNVSAGSSYGIPEAAPAGSVLGGSTQAAAAVLNTQGNTGNVTAASTGIHQIALNGLNAGTVPGMAGGTAAVAANTVTARAYGNSATNTISVTAPAAGRPTAAIGNYQTNSGTIAATATSVNYGIGISGAAAGSTLLASGNQVTAIAVGNSAVSTIAAR
ncbi:beta strand repeat-containing protein [Variovorax sp. Root411]|uniref:beta strand repeat-containing protein n=1 Tax=Variovorax sp. Root411 TaxID=1736530 RepID=UPI000700052E|nr:hypothetical protein [Variovorax sp. Root411]KQW57196.1 hypothetical protein ASC92_13125 [Variovorax sp. Root411]